VLEKLVHCVSGIEISVREDARKNNETQISLSRKWTIKYSVSPASLDYLLIDLYHSFK